MKERLVSAATSAITVIALAAVAWRVVLFIQAPPDPSKPRHIRGWEEYATVGQRVGPTNPKLTIVEFGDFQCPFCQQAAPTIKQILAEYPDEVALVYRHFPLSFHEHAVPAARASECAGAQGRFGEFYTLAYSQADSIESISWTDLAREAGVTDSGRFESCMTEDETPLRAIARDSAAVSSLGIGGTPYFLVGNLLIPGFPGPEELQEAVRRELRRTR